MYPASFDYHAPVALDEALTLLDSLGRPRLVAIEGSCASEGLVEVFIEPQLPEPVLTIAGASPAGETLADLAARIGWRVVREVDPAADAVVVASLGTDDEEPLRAALATPAGYVGLVASQRRGAATLAALREELDEETIARVRCPAGLDLGPSTQEEIAVAILAELVAWRHSRAGQVPPLHPGRVGAGPVRPDPVCGMDVAIAEATETAEVAGVLYYFCGAGCRRRFESDPASYLTEVNRT